MIQGPGTGTSNSVAAAANGQPVAVSNGEFRVPAAIVQALGQDFFDELVQNYHRPTGKANGPMPTSAAAAAAAKRGLHRARRCGGRAGLGLL